MIELDVFGPTKLNRAAVPVTDGIALKTSRDVKGGGETGHRRLKLGEIFLHVIVEHGGAIISDYGRKTCFEMIDKYRATAELSDAEFPACFHNGGSNLLPVFDRPLQFKADLTSHALP